MENNTETVSYTVYETTQARADRRLKWMWWLVVIMFVALIGTNAGWIVYENQFEDTVTVTNDVQTSDDAPAYVSGTGSITVNGESETDGN